MSLSSRSGTLHRRFSRFLHRNLVEQNLVTAFTSSARTSPLSKIRPLPTATTSPRVDFSAAEPVRTMPPADLASTSMRLIMTDQRTGFIGDNSPMLLVVTPLGRVKNVVLNKWGKFLSYQGGR